MSASPREPSAPRVARVARTGSTNDDLAAAAGADPEHWPHLSALTADHQDAGHGRAGRSWHTPPGQALTVSVLLRPTVPADALPAVSAVAGLAVARAVARFLPPGVRAATKWPNDVLLVPDGAGGGAGHRAGVDGAGHRAGVDGAGHRAGVDGAGHRAGVDGAGSHTGPPIDWAPVEGWGASRKVAGILARVVPAIPTGPAPDSPPPPDPRAAYPGVVLGIGVNVAQGAADLPVPWAGSLALAGSTAAVDDVLHAVLGELTALVTAWEAADGDLYRAVDPAGSPTPARSATVPSLHGALTAASATLGQRVRVDLADGSTVVGRAVGLAARGGLRVVDEGATTENTGTIIETGDVAHLRTFSRAEPDS